MQIQYPAHSSPDRIKRLLAALVFTSVLLLNLASGEPPVKTGQLVFDEQSNGFLYLPAIGVAPVEIPIPKTGDGCSLNEQEQALADEIMDHPDQQREWFACDPILAQVARAKAADMAERDYFGHVNPDGIGPNWLVEHSGYALPDWYEHTEDSNNIESLAGGQTNAGWVMADLLDSPGHRQHVLGLASFFAEQTDYGIGYFYREGSQYGHYWVIITARH